VKTVKTPPHPPKARVTTLVIKRNPGQSVWVDDTEIIYQGAERSAALVFRAPETVRIVRGEKASD